MSVKDKHTRLIADELRKRGYKVRWFHGFFFATKLGGKPAYFWSTRSPLTSQIAAKMIGRKDITDMVLTDANVSVPVGRTFTKSQFKEAVKFSWGRWPLVVKPAYSPGQEAGATLRVTNAVEFQDAFDKALSVDPRVMVQERFEGDEARVLVVGGRYVGAVRKVPDPITGKLRPPVFETITDLHPKHIETVERAARAFPGLGVAGFDLIVKGGFNRPGRSVVIEINGAPGIAGHHYPHYGAPVDAAGAIVDELERQYVGRARSKPRRSAARSLR